MTTDLAIYDMDRTVTRRSTYTPFLLHCAMARAPWRLLFLPLVALSMLAYLEKVIDRAELKQINHRLLLGRAIHPRDLKPLVDSFADRQVATNIRPGARQAIARDKSEGRRVVLATASYRLYADAIAERLGFDDVIATGSIIGLDERVHARIDGENCYADAKMRMIAAWVDICASAFWLERSTISARSPAARAARWASPTRSESSAPADSAASMHFAISASNMRVRSLRLSLASSAAAVPAGEMSATTRRRTRPGRSGVATRANPVPVSRVQCL